MPPIGPPIPSGENAPSGPLTGTAGEYASLDFKANKTTAIDNTVVLPKDWEGKDILVEVPFSVDDVDVIGDEIDLFLGYQSVACDEGESLSPATVFLPETVVNRTVEPPFASTFPVPGESKCVRFVIPASDVEESDALRLTFWRSRSDTYGGKFRMVGYRL